MKSSFLNKKSSLQHENQLQTSESIKLQHNTTAD